MKKLKYLIPLMGVIWQLALPMKMTIAQDIVPVNIPTEPKELVVYYAEKYRVSSKKMSAIIKCESGWNANALNDKGEYSVGLVQINLKAHKHITVEQAKDPNYAIRFLAYNMSQGRSSMWTCAKGL